MNITYTTAKNTSGAVVHWVHMDGNRIVGLIQKDERGYFYKPKGSKTTGEHFLTLEACKRSLEA